MYIKFLQIMYILLKVFEKMLAFHDQQIFFLHNVLGSHHIRLANFSPIKYYIYLIIIYNKFPLEEEWSHQVDVK